MAFERTLQSILARYLGKYLEIDIDNLNIAIYAGQVKLHNVKLRNNALSLLSKLPIQLTSSKIGLLIVNIPWHKLSSSPIIIELDSVFIEGVLDCQNLQEDEEISRLKSEVLIDNSPNENSSPNENGNGWGSWLYSSNYIMKVLDNIQLVFKNIHFKINVASYQNVSLTFSLKSLSIETTNSDFESCFVTRFESGSRLCKKLSIKGVEVSSCCILNKSTATTQNVEHLPIVHPINASLKFVYFSPTEDTRTNCLFGVVADIDAINVILRKADYEFLRHVHFNIASYRLYRQKLFEKMNTNAVVSKIPTICRFQSFDDYDAHLAGILNDTTLENNNTDEVCDISTKDISTTKESLVNGTDCTTLENNNTDEVCDISTKDISTIKESPVEGAGGLENTSNDESIENHPHPSSGWLGWLWNTQLDEVSETSSMCSAHSNLNEIEAIESPVEVVENNRSGSFFKLRFEEVCLELPSRYGKGYSKCALSGLTACVLYDPKLSLLHPISACISLDNAYIVRITERARNSTQTVFQKISDKSTNRTFHTTNEDILISPSLLPFHSTYETQSTHESSSSSFVHLLISEIEDFNKTTRCEKVDESTTTSSLLFLKLHLNHCFFHASLVEILVDINVCNDLFYLLDIEDEYLRLYQEQYMEETYIIEDDPQSTIGDISNISNMTFRIEIAAPRLLFPSDDNSLIRANLGYLVLDSRAVSENNNLNINLSNVYVEALLEKESCLYIENIDFNIILNIPNKSIDINSLHNINLELTPESYALIFKCMSYASGIDEENETAHQSHRMSVVDFVKTTTASYSPKKHKPVNYEKYWSISIILNSIQLLLDRVLNITSNQCLVNVNLLSDGFICETKLSSLEMVDNSGQTIISPMSQDDVCLITFKKSETISLLSLKFSDISLIFVPKIFNHFISFFKGDNKPKVDISREENSSEFKLKIEWNKIAVKWYDNLTNSLVDTSLMTYSECNVSLFSNPFKTSKWMSANCLLGNFTFKHLDQIDIIKNLKDYVFDISVESFDHKHFASFPGYHSDIQIDLRNIGVCVIKSVLVRFWNYLMYQFIPAISGNLSLTKEVINDCVSHDSVESTPADESSVSSNTSSDGSSISNDIFRYKLSVNIGGHIPIFLPENTSKISHEDFMTRDPIEHCELSTDNIVISNAYVDTFYDVINIYFPKGILLTKTRYHFYPNIYLKRFIGLDGRQPINVDISIGDIEIPNLTRSTFELLYYILMENIAGWADDGFVEEKEENESNGDKEQQEEESMIQEEWLILNIRPLNLQIITIDQVCIKSLISLKFIKYFNSDLKLLVDMSQSSVAINEFSLLNSKQLQVEYTNGDEYNAIINIGFSEAHFEILKISNYLNICQFFQLPPARLGQNQCNNNNSSLLINFNTINASFNICNLLLLNTDSINLYAISKSALLKYKVTLCQTQVLNLKTSRILLDKFDGFFSLEDSNDDFYFLRGNTEPMKISLGLKDAMDIYNLIYINLLNDIGNVSSQDNNNNNKKKHSIFDIVCHSISLSILNDLSVESIINYPILKLDLIDCQFDSTNRDNNIVCNFHLICYVFNSSNVSEWEPLVENIEPSAYKHYSDIEGDSVDIEHYVKTKITITSDYSIITIKTFDQGHVNISSNVIQSLLKYSKAYTCFMSNSSSESNKNMTNSSLSFAPFTILNKIGQSVDVKYNSINTDYMVNNGIICIRPNEESRKIEINLNEESASFSLPERSFGNTTKLIYFEPLNSIFLNFTSVNETYLSRQCELRSTISLENKTDLPFFFAIGEGKKHPLSKKEFIPFSYIKYEGIHNTLLKFKSLSIDIILNNHSVALPIEPLSHKNQHSIRACFAGTFWVNIVLNYKIEENVEFNQTNYNVLLTDIIIYPIVIIYNLLPIRTIASFGKLNNCNIVLKESSHVNIYSPNFISNIRNIRDSSLISLRLSIYCDVFSDKIDVELNDELNEKLFKQTSVKLPIADSTSHRLAVEVLNYTKDSVLTLIVFTPYTLSSLIPQLRFLIDVKSSGLLSSARWSLTPHNNNHSIPLDARTNIITPYYIQKESNINILPTNIQCENDLILSDLLETLHSLNFSGDLTGDLHTEKEIIFNTSNGENDYTFTVVCSLSKKTMSIPVCLDEYIHIPIFNFNFYAKYYIRNLSMDWVVETNYNQMVDHGQDEALCWFLSDYGNSISIKPLNGVFWSSNILLEEGKDLRFLKFDQDCILIAQITIADNTLFNTTYLNIYDVHSSPFNLYSPFTFVNLLKDTGFTITESSNLKTNYSWLLPPKSSIAIIPDNLDESLKVDIIYTETQMYFKDNMKLSELIDDSNVLFSGDLSSQFVRLTSICINNCIIYLLYNDIHEFNLVKENICKNTLLPRIQTSSTSDYYEEIIIQQSSDQNCTLQNNHNHFHVDINCISISIFNKTFQEILFIKIDKPIVDYTLHDLAFCIDGLEVTNYLEYSEYPIILKGQNGLLNFKLSYLEHYHNKLLYSYTINNLNCEINKSLSLTVDICALLVNIIPNLYGVFKEVLLTNDNNSGNIGPSIYLKELSISPFSLNLSTKPGNRSDKLNVMYNDFDSLIRVFGQVDDCDLFLDNSICISKKLYVSTSAFLSEILCILKKSILSNKNLKNLVGSSAALGDPIGFMNKLSSGFKDFVSDANSEALFKQTTLGIFSTLSKLAQTGSDTLVLVDDKFAKPNSGGINRLVRPQLVNSTSTGNCNSNQLINQKKQSISSFSTGVSTGLSEFGQGVSSGLKSAVSRPIQGYERQGTSGFIKGIGEGMAGLAINTTAGFLDFFKASAKGIVVDASSVNTQHNQQPWRGTTPRIFYTGGLLKLYSPFDHLCTQWVDSDLSNSFYLGQYFSYYFHKEFKNALVGYIFDEYHHLLYLVSLVDIILFSLYDLSTPALIVKIIDIKSIKHLSTEENSTKYIVQIKAFSKPNPESPIRRHRSTSSSTTTTGHRSKVHLLEFSRMEYAKAFVKMYTYIAKK